MFGRSKTADAATTSVSGSSSTTKLDGKGHATPKRREVEKGRRRAVAAPKTRKEAYAAQRERSRDQRGQQLAALRSGDERHLPARDRGPIRRYARDFIDSRRSVGEFFLPLALVILLLSFGGQLAKNTTVASIGSTLWLAIVVLIAIDTVTMSARLRRGLAKTFPDQSTRGALPYALMRSLQIRRFRLPTPRVSAGRRRRTS